MLGHRTLGRPRLRLATWGMRGIRLAVATALLPIVAVAAYQLALRFNGDIAAIDLTGNIIALVVLLVLLLGVSRLASDVDWLERVGTVLALGVAYFSLTWLIYGDPSRSVDDAPALVWLGTSIVAFSPALVIIPASKWAWAALRPVDELSTS